VVLTNNPRLNDTYADWNNDTESALKTCASFRRVPEAVQAGQRVQISGVAQVGMSGLSKVQYWVRPQASPLPPDDPYLTRGDWQDARILPPPEHWGGGLPDGVSPPVPLQFDRANREPLTWPLRNTIVLWTALLPGLAAGRYDLYCRTIDAQDQTQPMPRPLPKSGHNAIPRVTLEVVV
jgi:ABC-type amino acid transport substrate-binding protein